MTKSDAQIILEAFKRINALVEIANGWEDGETFYVDVIHKIKEQCKRAIPSAQRLVSAPMNPMRNLKKGDKITLVCLEDGANLSMEYQKFDVTIEK